MTRRVPRRVWAVVAVGVVVALAGAVALVASDRTSGDTAPSGPGTRGASLIGAKSAVGITGEREAGYRVSPAGAGPPKRTKDPEPNVHHDTSSSASWARSPCRTNLRIASVLMRLRRP